MCERSLAVLTQPPPRKHPIVLSMPKDKDSDEMYLCGYCGLNLDRNLPACLLERSLIACPNCAAVNRA
jgi:hypothetical protein